MVPQSSDSVELSARQNARLRERLVALREREGLSERALAARAGISVGAVRSVGETKNGPRLATLLALTGALGLQSIDQLLGPSPAALLTVHDRLAAEGGEDAMRALLLSDQRH